MKTKMFKKRSQKTGLPPGSLIHIGERRSERTKITLIDFDEANFNIKKDASIGECARPADSKRTKWIDVEGLHDVAILEKVGEAFGLHPLVMEDILNTDQRPKMEDYGDYLYIVMKMLCFDEKKGEVVSDQVSIILGKNFVISFQEGELDVFDPLRGRLQEGKGKARKMGADYLAYSLIDAVVDNYFLMLERFGDEIERIEEELVKNPNQNTVHRIHSLKHDMLYLRRSVWPLRELVGGLDRGESPLFGEAMNMYLRDVYDHVVYLVDTIETFRDMLSGMLDIYLSSINNRMNEIMKVLTIIATLFMPLTFLAGVYGMNFKYMPELEWSGGYPATLIVMASIAVVMLIFFRKRKWI